MFDLGWTELTVIFIIGLIIIGPKDLPKVVRAITNGIARMRGFANEFRSGFDEVMREAELKELSDELRQIHADPMALSEAGTDDMFVDAEKTTSKKEVEEETSKRASGNGTKKAGSKSSAKAKTTTGTKTKAKATSKKKAAGGSASAKSKKKPSNERRSPPEAAKDTKAASENASTTGTDNA